MKGLKFYPFLLLLHFSAVANQPRVEFLGIEQGLSNNAVTSIYQDASGFMWFGTYDGLNKYDGYSFKTYRNKIGDSTTIGGNHIFSINGDAAGKLWVGGINGLDIFYPSTGRFIKPSFIHGTLSKNIHSGVTHIKAIEQGNRLMANLINEGLLIFHHQSLTATYIPLTVNGKRLPRYAIEAIEYDSLANQGWLVIAQVGLCLFDVKTKRITLVDDRIKSAECLRSDGKGGFWIGTTTNLLFYNSHTRKLDQNLLPRSFMITDIFADQTGSLWVSSDGGGLWQYNTITRQATQFLDSKGGEVLNSNVIYAVYNDKENRKWLGTLRGGINILHPDDRLFKGVKFPAEGNVNAANNFILSFCEKDEENIWIGTDGAGLRLWNRTSNQFINYQQGESPLSLSSNFITNLHIDSEKDLWVATWFGGLNRLKRGSNTFERFAFYNPLAGEIQNNVWFVFEDRSRKLWASTVNNGTLYTYDRQTNQFNLFDHRIGNFQSMVQDEEGTIWAGNYGSLVKIDTLQKNHLIYRIGYPVRDIHEDRLKNFWIGTEGGGLLLFNRKTGRYRQITTEDGLPNNSVMQIVEDDNNNLWISTFNGMCRYNIESGAMHNYSQSDGLQSNQFSFHGAKKLSTGELIFGGIKGFNLFKPGNISEKKRNPRVYLSGLNIENIPVEKGYRYVVKSNNITIEEITVPYNKAILQIDFVAPEYSSTENLIYQYKLAGWDKDWINAGQDRNGNYSRLREGNYQFLVRTSTRSQQWNSPQSILKITILPPWYRSWWARLLFLSSLGAIILGYSHYRKRQENLKYQVKVATLEKEVEKDLAEKKIDFFTHISHEFRTPLTLIIGPLKEYLTGKKDWGTNELSLVYRNARRLLSLVDQLLIFRNADAHEQKLRISKFDLLDTCREVFLNFKPLAASKSLQYNFTGMEDHIDIYGDKEKIEIILFNLLSNAIKFTPAGGIVTFKLENNHDHVEINVIDSGKGIPPEFDLELFEPFKRAENIQATGFGIGLYVSRKLISLHRGKLWYQSWANEGTIFHMVLLKGRHHFEGMPISEGHSGNASLLKELVLENEEMPVDNLEIPATKTRIFDDITSGKQQMVVVDDNAEIRSYIKRIFCNEFTIHEADDGTTAIEVIRRVVPHIVISDVMMEVMGGLELCQRIKTSPSLAHIPVILLTASSCEEVRLKSYEGGADGYITKPFEESLLRARVENILRGRERLQDYFLNAVILQPVTAIAGEHKRFIEDCITIVNRHIADPEFTIKTFCREIGMSHPSLYKKVKAVSGLTVNVFIRHLRLRKAAELLITTDKPIVEVTYITGFNDIKYFREQFYKLYGINPSDYIKRYRRVLGSKPNRRSDA